MRHCLYILYDGLTDPLAQSQVIPYLQGLCLEGYRFTILSCEKPDRFEQREQMIRDRLAPYQIRWEPLMYHKKPPVLSTVYDLQRMKRKASEICREDPVSLVHCRSYLAGLVALHLKQHFEFRFLFDIRGFWVDEQIDGGMWNLRNPVYKAVYHYFRRMEKLLYAEADHIISLTHNGADVIRARDEVDAPVSVIPCCADMGLFERARVPATAQQAWRDRLCLSREDKVITYLGSVGTWYLLDEMLAFFKLLCKRESGWKFLFITPESEQTIYDAAKRQDVPVGKIRVTSAERMEVPTLLSLGLYSIFFILPSHSKRASSPTKMGEIMAMGIPLVCNAEVGDVDHLMQCYKPGVRVRELSENGYEDAISWLLEGSFDSTAIRGAAIEYYSLDKGVQSYMEVYAKLLNQAAIAA